MNEELDRELDKEKNAMPEQTAEEVVQGLNAEKGNTDDTYLDKIEVKKTEEEINQEKQEDAKKPLWVRIGKELLSWIPIMIIALVVALFLDTFVIINARVPSGSMMNTIMVGDRMLGFRLAYLNSDPERGDIIIFKAPDNPDELYVKRVIGLPGDTVQIIDGKVYINDSEDPLDEDYVYLSDGVEDMTNKVYEVPEDSYFVLGDNRNNSHDSRYWTNTYVSRDAIMAKAICVYLPFEDFSIIDGYDYE